MGRFESLIDSPLKIELFKQKYDIVPQNKLLQIRKQGRSSFL